MCFEQEFKTLISTSYIYTLVTFRQCSVKMDVLNMNVPLFGAELQGVHLEAKKKNKDRVFTQPFIAAI